MARMPYDEVFVWQAYRREHGTLSVGRKVDEGAALLAFMSGKVAGKNAKISDFLPQPPPPEMTNEEINASILSVFGMMARGQNGEGR